MWDNKNYSVLRLWPLRISLLNKSGYTLWASPENSDTSYADILLAVGENILLFKSPKQMGDFIISQSSSNLSTMEEYKELGEILQQYEWKQFKAFDVYNFKKISEVFLQAEWDKWNLKICSKVLNCLNLMRDMAITINDPQLITQFKTETQVGQLMDTLTFIDSPKMITLKKLDKEIISDTYLQILSSLEKKVLQVC